MNIKQEIQDILNDAVYYPQLSLPNHTADRLRRIQKYLDTAKPGEILCSADPRRVEVYQAIRTERDYQDEQWGKTQSSGRPGNGERSLDEFALYISGHADTLRGFCTEFTDETAKLHAVRRIAALCVWCMEQHGVIIRDGRKTR